MKFGFSWPSGFREDLSTHIHTHTFLHTRTQQLRVNPDEKKMGGGCFEGKALYFCGGGGGGGAVVFLFSIQLAVGFCENV